MRSGLRHCENFAVIDAHAAGETQAVTVQRIGPDLVFGRVWKECGIQEIIQSLLQARRYDFDVERAIYLTVLHRLFASGSEGIALAKQRGAYTGRKKALIPQRVEELCARVGNGERKTALAREFGISRETLYQYLRQNAGRKARGRLNGKGDK